MGRLDSQQQNKPVGRLTRATTTPQATPQQGLATGFLAPLRNAPSNIKALARGEFGVSDIIKEVPSVVGRNAVKAAETFTPAATNFIKTTGGIIGEGLAYATDENVREQYKAGNLDILPNVTKTTQKGLLKDTVAAGLEAAILRGAPKAMTGKVGTRATIGGLEGIGFAITEGMAKDQSVDEIIDNAKLYGVSGAALNTALPWLGPLLRKEIGRAPKEVVSALRKETKTVPDKVVQFADDKTGEVKMYRIPEGDLADIKNIVDDGRTADTPIAMGEKVDGGVWHITAKTPEQMLSREGVVDAGTITAEDLRKISARKTKPVAVQGEQIPIGGPTQGASRLEARLVAQAEDPAYQAGVNNYSKYSNASDAPEITGATNVEQIKRATASVEAMSPSQINDIVSGYAPLPDGVLRTAFIKAATEKALLEGDAALVARLGRVVGQAARRFGQEIQFTKNFDELDPVTNIADLLSVRLKAVERKLPKGQTVRGITQETVTKARKQTTANQIKIQQAEELLNSILC